MTTQYRINIVIWDDNDAEDVRVTLAGLLADHDFCVKSLSVEPPVEHDAHCERDVAHGWHCCDCQGRRDSGVSDIP